MQFVKERDLGGRFKFGGRNPFFVIAGPCTLESLELGLEVGEQMKTICSELGLGYVFKASFDKANRTSIKSYRGPGIEQGLKWLGEIGSKLDVPLLTDIHLPEQCKDVAGVVDILQIPAFLCRQTDIIVAAAETGAWVNVKKGQFVAPADAASIIDKVKETGSEKYILTDRGASFGYHNLVSDFRTPHIVRSQDIPFCYDATHSVQFMGGGSESSGDREFIPTLGRAAAAAGMEALFMEVHPNPPKAVSDKKTQLYLKDAKQVLTDFAAVDALVKGFAESQVQA